MATTRYPSDFTGTPNTDYLEIKMIRRDYAANNPTGNEYKMEDPGNGLPNTLILNMPQKVTESIAQSWATAKLGEIGPYLGKRGPKNSSATDGMTNTIKRLIENFLLDGAVKNFQKLGSSNLTENGILSATSGVVYNPNLEVLYDGPDFRRFQFQFSLFTKSENDASAIYSIVRFFQIASVPSASGDNISVGGDISQVLVDSAAVTVAEGIADTATQGVNDAIDNYTPRGNTPQNQNQQNQGNPFQNTINTGITAIQSALGAYGGAALANTVFSSGAENRFIKQPPFLLLTYKRGANVHPFITPLMPCSLDNLTIDYTPTGNYTVMDNFGESSVATVVGVTITIQLTEVKALFKEDYSNNFANRAPGV